MFAVILTMRLVLGSALAEDGGVEASDHPVVQLADGGTVSAPDFSRPIYNACPVVSDETPPATVEAGFITSPVVRVARLNCLAQTCEVHRELVVQENESRTPLLIAAGAGVAGVGLGVLAGFLIHAATAGAK